MAIKFGPRGPNPVAAQMNRGIGPSPSMNNSGPMNQPPPTMGGGQPPMFGMPNSNGDFQKMMEQIMAKQPLPEGYTPPDPSAATNCWPGTNIPKPTMGAPSLPGGIVGQNGGGMKSMPGAGPMAPSMGGLGGMMQKFGKKQ